MRAKVLVLNQSYEPHKVVNWQKAVTHVVTGKAEVLREYDGLDIKSVRFTLKCPAVIRLKKYVNMSRSRVKFNRRNVYSRDFYTCQYCGAQPGAHKLTYDHVIPRSKGGKTVWNNITTCCEPCNLKKGDKTLEESGMSPRSTPKKPKWTPSYNATLKVNAPHEWLDFLW